MILKITLAPLRFIFIIFAVIVFSIAYVLSHVILILDVVSYRALMAISFLCGVLGLVLIFCQFFTEITLPMLYFVIVDLGLFAASAIIATIPDWVVVISSLILNGAKSLLSLAVGKDII